MQGSKRVELYVNYLLFVIIFIYSVVLIANPELFFVDDCYFYFQVAYHVAHGAGSTFNEITLTNGYHPL